MHFTKSPLKTKKPVTNGTNKMGQYYSNVRVPVKNNHTAAIAKRIDKNMTSLAVPDQPTNINLDDMLSPITELLQPFEAEEFPKINMHLKSVDITNTESLINIINNYKEPHMNENISEISMQLKVIDTTDKDSLVNIVNNHKDPPINEKIQETSMKLGEINTTDDDTLVNIVNKHKEPYVKEPALETSMKLGEINATSITGDSLINSLNNDIRRIDHFEPDDKEETIRNKEIEIPLKLLQLTKPIIENVYQEKYNNNMNATGLGDFIRGSYFLLEYCDNNNIPCNINILNHPVSQFLEMYKNKQPLIYTNVNKFELTNHNPSISHDGIISNIYNSSFNDDFIKFLSKQRVFNKKLYIHTIAYPLQISQKHKEYMKQILQPNMRLKSLVDKMLVDLELISKQFTIIHIRYGDDFLIQNKTGIKKSHLKIIEDTLDLNQNSLDLNQKYLLISDNTIIKNILQLKYPFIKIHLNEITHTGEGIRFETNKLQNTMIDFNLFSHATNVIAFSVYIHGTGFSRWATETYSVPYNCKYLN